MRWRGSGAPSTTTTRSCGSKSPSPRRWQRRKELAEDLRRRLELLDDPVSIVAVHDPLQVGVDVVGDNHELVVPRVRRLPLLRKDVEGREAVLVSAFAHDRDGLLG